MKTEHKKTVTFSLSVHLSQREKKEKIKAREIISRLQEAFFWNVMWGGKETEKREIAVLGFGNWGIRR